MRVEDVIHVAMTAGFKGESLILAVSIAGAESDFNENKIGDVSLADKSESLCGGLWMDSIGLWQIRSLQNPQNCSFPDTLRDAEKLKSAQFNADAAYAISQGGTDFTPWSTYVERDYVAFYNYVKLAVENYGIS